jgi:hypothetical protein
MTNVGSVSLEPCPEHAGLSFTFKATSYPPMRRVCPHCEPGWQAAIHDSKKAWDARLWELIDDYKFDRAHPPQASRDRIKSHIAKATA